MIVERVTGDHVRRVVAVQVGLVLAGGRVRQAVVLLVRYALREALAKKEGDLSKMQGELG
jgi:hypothetical protein